VILRRERYDDELARKAALMPASPPLSGSLRRLSVVSLAVLLGMALVPLAAPASAATRCAADGGVGSTPASREAALTAVTCLVNDERGAWGLPPLVRHARLDAAAGLHDDWMARTHEFSHAESGPGAYESFVDRFEAAGYSWSAGGENIAAGYGTAYDVVQGWLHSAGHCTNILSPSYVDLGMDVSTGYVVSGTRQLSPLWTMDLGRQPGVPAPSIDTTAQEACSAGAQFQPRSQALGGTVPPVGDDPSGPAGLTSPTTPTPPGRSAAKKAPVKLRVAARGKHHRVLLKIRVVTVKSGVKKPARGHVIVARKNGTLLKRAKLSARGKVKVVLRKQHRGKHRLLVTYTGKPKIRSAVKAVVVRVK